MAAILQATYLSALPISMSMTFDSMSQRIVPRGPIENKSVVVQVVTSDHVCEDNPSLVRLISQIVVLSN